MDSGSSRDYVREREAQMLEEYRAFCRIPSVSSDAATCREAADFVVEALRRRGATVRVFETPGNPIVYAEVKGKSDRTVLLYSHYDVVPTGDLGQWQHPPFAATLADGRIWGRGTADHKGSIMGRIQALDFFGPEGPPCTVKFVIEGNEEEGSPYLGAFIQANKDLVQCEAALYSGWARAVDGSPRINGGGRGSFSVKLTARGPKQSLHGSYASIAPNATLRLMRALDTLWDGDGRVAVGGFFDGVEPLTAELQDALKSVPIDLAREAARIGVSADQLPGPEEFALRLFMEPTVSLYRFAAEGSSASSVPATVSAWLRISLVPNQEPEEILTLLRTHLEKQGYGDVEVTSVGAMTIPVRSPLQARVWDVVRAASRAVFGRDPISVPLSSGSGPRHLFTRNLHIPIIADAGCSHAESNDHSYNENIYVEHYLEGVQHCIEILRHW